VGRKKRKNYKIEKNMFLIKVCGCINYECMYVQEVTWRIS